MRPHWLYLVPVIAAAVPAIEINNTATGDAETAIPINVTTPSLQSCQQSTLKWTVGTPPYKVSILEGDNLDNVLDVESTNATEWPLQVLWAPNTTLVVRIEDENLRNGYSAQVMVQQANPEGNMTMCTGVLHVPQVGGSVQNVTTTVKGLVAAPGNATTSQLETTTDTATASTSATDTAPSKHASSGPAVGAIVGIAVGVVALLACILVVLFLILRRKRRAKPARGLDPRPMKAYSDTPGSAPGTTSTLPVFSAHTAKAPRGFDAPGGFGLQPTVTEKLALPPSRRAPNRAPSPPLSVGEHEEY